MFRTVLILSAALSPLALPGLAHAAEAVDVPAGPDADPSIASEHDTRPVHVATVSFSPDVSLGRGSEPAIGGSLRLRATPLPQVPLAPTVVLKGSLDHDRSAREHLSLTTGLDWPVLGDAHHGISVGPRAAFHQHAIVTTSSGAHGSYGGAVVAQILTDSGLTVGATADVQRSFDGTGQHAPLVRAGVDIGHAFARHPDPSVRSASRRRTGKRVLVGSAIAGGLVVGLGAALAATASPMDWSGM